MNEALCSILCGEEEWWYDQDGRSISFNSDGTGEVCSPFRDPGMTANRVESYGVVAILTIGSLLRLSGRA